jgi:multidrug efflux system outer membrane protein
VQLQEAKEGSESIKNVSWNNYFISPVLQNLINKTLANNRDLKIAVLNLESTKAQYGVSSASLYPQLNLNGQYYKSDPTSYASQPPYLALINASYEVDLFGKVASTRKSALETLLSQEQNKKTVEISLISQVVSTYLDFLAAKEIFEISKEAYKIQEKQTEIIGLNYKNGIASMTDVITADSLLLQAKINYQNYTSALENSKNALALLVGTNVDEFLMESVNGETLNTRIKLEDITVAEKLLEDLPSSNLLSRPDIKMAEHNLKAANASIGAARAAFFPSISLTGSAGYGSTDLSTLFSNRFWIFNPQINIPIFTGFQNKSNLEIAEIRKNIYILDYEQAIQNAFFESLNAFEARKIYKLNLESSQADTRAKSAAFDISKARYDVGMDSMQTLLSANINLLLARQNEITARKDYIIALVNLYKVLGGGSDVDEQVKDKDK